MYVEMNLLAIAKNLNRITNDQRIILINKEIIF